MKKMSRKNPLGSGKDLFKMLEEWLVLNKDESDSKTIGSSEIGVTPLIWVRLDGQLYHINSDSKLIGIKEFVSNKSNKWHIIKNNRGKLNRVTNDKHKIGIYGFYMYKILK